MDSDEQLIVIVQEYKHLYDLGDPNYHNIMMRENSWEEIGQKLSLPGSLCKKKWKSLRENFRKAMNNRKTKSGQSAKKMKPWRFEQQMEFIKPYIFSYNEEQTTNILPLPQSSSPSPSLSPSLKSPSLDDDLAENFDLTTGSDGDLSRPTSVCSHSAAVIMKKAKTSTTDKVVPPGTAAEMMRHYINLKTTAATSPATTGDHLTKFFQSMEETVRTLPKQTQVKLKGQISQLVHNAELEALEGNLQTPHHQQPPSYPLYPTQTHQTIQPHQHQSQSVNQSYFGHTLPLPNSHYGNSQPSYTSLYPPPQKRHTLTTLEDSENQALPGPSESCDWSTRG